MSTKVNYLNVYQKEEKTNSDKQMQITKRVYLGIFILGIIISFFV